MSDRPPLTLRDEANMITAYAFRNGFLEDLHAGKDSPILDDQEHSRITNDEMRKLMIEASERVAELLRMKQDEPEAYDRFMCTYWLMYCQKWQR